MPISSPERFKAADAASYDPLSASFDRLSERHGKPVARHLVELAELPPGARLLDLATGTGLVAFEAARLVGRGGAAVAAVDLSAGMLAQARRRSRAAGEGSPPAFVRADGERLPFAGRSFDVALCLFGLLHFPRPELALAEAARVLRPGGRLALAVGSGPPRLSLAGLRDAAGRLRALAARRRGRLAEAPHLLESLLEEGHRRRSGEEESPLARRHRNRARVVPRLVAAAGFGAVERSWRGYVSAVGSAEELWQVAATFSSRARKRLARLELEEVAALRRRHDAVCAEVLARGGRLTYPHAALFVRARREG